MSIQNNLKTYAAMYCDVILMDSFIRARDYAAVGRMTGPEASIIWLGFIFAVYIFNFMFLKKARSVSSLVILNLILGIPEAAVLYSLYRPESVWGVLISFAALIFCHARTVNRFFEPVTIDGAIRFFEMTVFGYLIFRIYNMVMNADGGIGWSLFSGIIISLLSLIIGRLEGAEKMNSSSGHKGMMIPLLLIAAVALISFVFIFFFSDTAGNGISTAAAGAGTFIIAVLKFLLSVLEYLIKLAPESDYTAVDDAHPSAVSAADIQDYEYDHSVTGLICAVAAIAAVIIFIIVLIRLRSVNLKARLPIDAQEGEGKGGPGLIAIIRSWISDKIKDIRNRIRLISIRNTSAGIILSIAEKCRIVTRYENETYSSYIRRVALEMGKCSGEIKDESEMALLRKKLYRLADEFEHQFYAGADPVIYSRSESDRIIGGVIKMEKCLTGKK